MGGCGEEEDRWDAYNNTLRMMDRMMDTGYNTGFGSKETGIIEDILMDRRWCLDGWLYDGEDGHNASRQKHHNKRLH